MKKFVDKFNCKLILIEKKDLKRCIACDLKGVRADYFIVPSEIKDNELAMSQLETCTLILGSKHSEIFYYE